MRSRVLTALAGIPVVLAACFWTNPLGLGVLLGLIALIGFAEAWSICEKALPEKARFLGTPVLALLWVVIPLVSLVFLYLSGATGRELPVWNVKSPILLALLPLWAGDSAAIFAGKAFGKRPLAPTISPKKTWEGAIANFLACVLVAWGVGEWVGIPVFASMGIGGITGVLGQAGDLFESWLKRKADLKDSGSILPGHGGILDRIDSLLFTAIPVTCVYLLVSAG